MIKKRLKKKNLYIANSKFLILKKIILSTRKINGLGQKIVCFDDDKSMT